MGIQQEVRLEGGDVALLSSLVPAVLAIVRGAVPAGGGSVIVDSTYTPGPAHGATLLVQGLAYDATGNLANGRFIQVVLKVSPLGVMTVVATAPINAATGDGALTTWTMVAGVTAGNTLSITFTTPAAYPNAMTFAAEFIVVGAPT
jgi:hypothetical protein